VNVRGCRIIGLGSYLPQTVLSNKDLEGMVDTTDEWIMQRTGIRERRIAAKGEKTSDLAAKAGAEAMKNASVGPEEIDLVAVASISQETAFPSAACHVQAKLGLVNAGAFDLLAACSGFIYSMVLVSSLIRTGGIRTALLIGAECLSSVTDYTDRSSCILFGDGAGAVVLRAGTEQENGILYYSLGADGAGGGCMVLTAANNYDGLAPESRNHYITIRGREVYRFAVQKMVDLIRDSLAKTGYGPQDISLVVPHQVNIRILEAAARRSDIPMEKLYINIDRFGNTSAASVPIALDEAREKGLIKHGDLVLLVAFGGGLTWGSCLVRY